MNLTDDNHLMRSVKEGNLHHLNELFSRYQPVLMGYFVNQTGNRELAKDLTQDTFWKILRFRQTFNQNYRFKSWMFQIARNIYADHCRTTKNKILPFESDASEFEAIERPTTDSIEHSEKHEILQQALKRLSSDKREILILARFEQLNYKEIGTILGCSANTVKVRVYRALQDLKSQYEQLAEGVS